MVTAVNSDPLDNPTRMASASRCGVYAAQELLPILSVPNLSQMHAQNVVWSTPRKNASEQSADLRKAEIFINNRGFEGDDGGKAGGGSGGAPTPFCCFELYRCDAGAACPCAPS